MMRRRPMPSAEYLHECFDLDIETGRLFWRVRPAHHFQPSVFRSAQATANNWNSIWAGQEALIGSDNGYRSGLIHRQKIFAHRAIWKMVHGVEPDTIDHINGDPGDNRLANLRNVSHRENCRNQRLNARSTSGAAGVYWHKASRRWRVVAPGRPASHIGYFKTFEAASAARKAAEAAAGFHPNHGQRRAS